MKKNMKRIVAILLLVVLAFSIFSVVTAAAPITDPLDGVAATSSDASTKVRGVGNTVIGVVQVIGVVVAVVMLIFLGIKYVIGSTEDKANIKKSVAIYIVGAIFILSAVAILGVVRTMGDAVTTASTEIVDISIVEKLA